MTTTQTALPFGTPAPLSAPVVSRGYAVCRAFPTMQSVIVQAAVQFPIRTGQPCRVIAVRDASGLQAPKGVDLRTDARVGLGVALASNERLPE